MKKILAIFCLTVLISVMGCTKQEVVEEKAKEDPQTEVLQFTEYEALANKFMEYCNNGDIEGIYSLYYDDLLTSVYENVSDKITKEQFDSMLLAEMATIYDFESFEYGCAEMPPLSSPLSYVNQLLNYTGSESLTLEESRVTNCCNLRVYKNDGSLPSDHMMACIDGYWYFIV